MYSEDEKVFYMKKAFALAKRAKGNTSPNPAVGAVIVKGGVIVGKGMTKQHGGDHAEATAVKEAGEAAKDADIFVTLEPCSRRYEGKKTRPCTEIIIEAGMRAVYMGTIDQNEMADGNALNVLKKAGIKTELGIMEEKLKPFYRDFFKFIKSGLPWVTVKYAMTLDGKIAAKTGDSKWISCALSRRLVHKLRADADAVIVGKNTFVKDDPMLNVRYGSRQGKQPLPVIVNPSFSFPESSYSHKILQLDKYIIIGSTNHKDEGLKRFERSKLIFTGQDPNGLDIKSALIELGKLGIVNVLAEGGSRLIASLLDSGSADELYAFIAPKFVGGENARTPMGGIGKEFIHEAHKLSRWRMRKSGSDILIHGLF